MDHKKPYRKNGWVSMHRRGEIIVDFKKELLYGFRIGVGTRGTVPFPEKLADVEAWYYCVWAPDAISASCRGKYPTPEAAMIAGEKAAIRVLSTAHRHMGDQIFKLGESVEAQTRKDGKHYA
jgi:hypothetical protein